MKTTFPTKEDIKEFKQSYQLERRNYPSGFVPARMMTVTGITCWELVKMKVAETDGQGGYRPL